MSARTAGVFPILLVNFIGTLGYSIVLPFLVVIVLSFGGNELIYGVLGATYSFFQLIGAPVLGRWSDKIGRRRVLLLSQIGTCLAWVLFVVALYLPSELLLELDYGWTGPFLLTLPLLLLFLARALDGITGGNVSVANAYLADVTTDEHRKEDFGKMSASSNLGFIAGPIIAGLLGSTVLGNLLPILAALVISLIAIAVIYFGLKEAKSKEPDGCVSEDQNRKMLSQEHKECYTMADEKAKSWTELLSISSFPLMLVFYFFIFLGFNFFYVAFPVHALTKLDWDVFELGVFFSISGGLMVLFQGPVLSYVSKRVADRTLFNIGGIILAIGFSAFFFDNIVFLGAGLLLFAAGNGLMWPSYLALLSSIGDKKEQGGIQGMASSVGSFASIIGLLAGGVIYSSFGPYVFLLPAVFILVVVGISATRGVAKG